MSASDYKDPRWHADQFGRQPLSDVRQALRYLDQHEIAKYNAGSIAVAKLGTVAVGMMGGKKSGIKPEDFLPFDTRTAQRESGVTDASMRVLFKLMKNRKLDGKLIAILADEIKSFSWRNQER